MGFCHIATRFFRDPRRQPAPTGLLSFHGARRHSCRLWYRLWTLLWPDSSVSLSTQEYLVRTKLPPNPSAVFQSGPRVLDVWQNRPEPMCVWGGRQGKRVGMLWKHKNLCKTLGGCGACGAGGSRGHPLHPLLFHLRCYGNRKCMWENSFWHL